jgi:hypothetical protein
MGNLTFFGFSIMIAGGIWSIILIIDYQYNEGLGLLLSAALISIILLLADDKPNDLNCLKSISLRFKTWWS